MLYNIDVRSGFAALSRGLLSETYLEAHRVVLINKTEDEELGEQDEISEEELRQLQVHNLWGWKSFPKHFLNQGSSNSKLIYARRTKKVDHLD